jgi:hypothetical protein
LTIFSQFFGGNISKFYYWFLGSSGVPPGHETLRMRQIWGRFYDTVSAEIYGQNIKMGEMSIYKYLLLLSASNARDFDHYIL